MLCMGRVYALGDCFLDGWNKKRFSQRDRTGFLPSYNRVLFAVIFTCNPFRSKSEFFFLVQFRLMLVPRNSQEKKAVFLTRHLNDESRTAY